MAETGTVLMDLPGIGPPAQPGCSSRSATWPGSPTATTSRPGTGPAGSTPPPATRSDTGCPAAGTDRSTARCTSWPPSSPQPDRRPRLLRPQESQREASTKPCAAQTTTLRHRLPSLVDDLAKTTRTAGGRIREGNRATTLTPARPAHNPMPALRISHFPDPSTTQPRTPLPTAS